jgi:hypothetical protein
VTGRWERWFPRSGSHVVELDWPLASSYIRLLFEGGVVLWRNQRGL